MLKTDKTVIYLKTALPLPDPLTKVEAMAARFDDEMPMHLAFVKSGGEVTCFGRQLVRFISEERLAEMMASHEDAGCPIFYPHAYSLKQGGMKKVDQQQLAFQREADSLGLSNPGKMLAWKNPDWRASQSVHLYETA